MRYQRYNEANYLRSIYHLFAMKHLIITSFMLLFGCVQKEQPGNNRATYIRELAKRVSTQKLPFKYDMANDNPDLRHKISKNSLDTLYFHDLNGSVGGVLPDTSTYFGFIFYEVGDSFYPFLLTVDNEGRIIDRQSIGIAHFGGIAIDVESCVDMVSIGEDLQIDMLYTLYGTSETNDSIPKTIEVCNKISGNGSITS